MLPDYALASALEFTDQDLTANRAGFLSSAQSALLGNARAGASRMGKRNAVILVVFLIVVGGLLIAVESTASGTGSQAALGIVGSVVAAFLIVGLATRRNRARWDAMASGTVSRAYGQVKTRTRGITGEDGTTQVYEVTIGGTRFRVPGEHILAAFTDGRSYAGYYVGAGVTAMLLSAEPL